MNSVKNAPLSLVSQTSYSPGYLLWKWGQRSRRRHLLAPPPCRRALVSFSSSSSLASLRSVGVERSHLTPPPSRSWSLSRSFSSLSRDALSERGESASYCSVM